MTHPHLEGLIRKWREDAAMHSEQARNKEWAEWVREEHSARASELNGCASELSQALAALPGGGVDGAMVERAAAVFYGDRWPGVDTPSYRGHVRAALTAALSPAPNPHEADQS